MHKTLNLPIIDFHTHIMPDKRTAGGMRWLKNMAAADPNGLFRETAVDVDLTSDKARSMLTAAGVDYYFNMFFPIKEGSTDEVNRWNYRLSLQDPRCIPFVSLLPGDADKTGILDQAFNINGFLGLKLHPYVQSISVVDPRLYEVYDYLQAAGRPALIHTGFEDMYRADSNQDGLRALLQQFPRLMLVIPHLCYPDVDAAFRFLEQYPRTYLDATNALWCFKLTPPKDIWWDMIERYSERMVFGTDFSMGMHFPAQLYEHFAQLPLSTKAKGDLLFRTAAKMARQCGRELTIGGEPL